MRLFLAIEPDRPAQAQIARLLLDVQRVLGDLATALRWTPATNIHATLHFLGEVDAARAARLVDALGGAVAEAPFETVVQSIGVLPASGTPRVLWAGMTVGLEPLRRVHAFLGDGLRRGGIATESREFLPHLTLARVRDRERARARLVRERLSEVAVPDIRWNVDHVTLFRSDLSGPVPKYEPVHEIPLRADR
jgi:2'-5' RNA ligase